MTLMPKSGGLPGAACNAFERQSHPYHADQPSAGESDSLADAVGTPKYELSAGQVASILERPEERMRPFMSALNAAMDEFAINTSKRAAAFIATIGHETVRFKHFVELASGEAYDTGTLAKRLGNTPEADGDGQRYKGRGAIQLTGLYNYRAASEYFGVDFVGQPERAAHLEWAFRIAGWYWHKHGLNSLADAMDLGNKDCLDPITRKVNGGLNGKSDRDTLFWRACKELGLT